MRRSARLFIPVLAVFACVVGCSQPAAKGDKPASPETAFPANYTAWKKVNASPIIREGEQQVRNLYANDVALSRSGPSPAFPIGSILVKEERQLLNEGGKVRPGDVYRVSVMFKVGKRVGNEVMAGWSFKAFDPLTKQEFPKDRVDPDGCYFCHADAGQRDYVYSDVR